MEKKNHYKLRDNIKTSVGFSLSTYGMSIFLKIIGIPWYFVDFADNMGNVITGSIEVDKPPGSFIDHWNAALDRTWAKMEKKYDLSSDIWDPLKKHLFRSIDKLSYYRKSGDPVLALKADVQELFQNSNIIDSYTIPTSLFDDILLVLDEEITNDLPLHQAFLNINGQNNIGLFGLLPDRNSDSIEMEYKYPVEHNNMKYQENILISNLVLPKGKLIGRKSLLAEIDKRIKQSDSIVFLHGEPGIGKTLLAQQYAQLSKDNYEAIIFAQYTNHTNIMELVCDDSTFTIRGFKKKDKYESLDEYYKRKMEIMRMIVSDSILIILDNYDTDYDCYFDDFVRLNCKKIVTSRYKHNEFSNNELEVGIIEDKDSLYNIFEYYYGNDLQEDKTYIDEILKLVDYHTYAIELIAKQMQASYLSTEEMLSLIKDGMKNLPTENIKARGSERSAFKHICMLYEISDLGEDERYILRCLSLVGIAGVDVRLFKKWASLNNFDRINQLITRGWIRKNFSNEGVSCSLHPLAIEVIQECLSPDTNNCEKFLFNIQTYLLDTWSRVYTDNLKIEKNIDSILQYFRLPDVDDYILFCYFGSYYWQIGEFDKSIINYSYFYNCSKDNPDIDTELLAIIERDLAGAYFNSGLEQESKFYYEKSLEHQLASDCPENPDLALAYEKVARCYTWDFCKNFQIAFAFFTKSLEVRNKCKQTLQNGGTVRVWRSLFRNFTLLDLINSYGSCQMEIGRMFQSMGCYLAALYFTHMYYNSLRESNLSNQNGLSYCLYDMAHSWYKISLVTKSLYKENSQTSVGWDEISKNISNIENSIVNSILGVDLYNLYYKKEIFEGLFYENTVQSMSTSISILEELKFISSKTDLGELSDDNKCIYISKVFIEKANEIIHERRGNRAVDTIDYEELLGDIYYANSEVKKAFDGYNLALSTATTLLDSNNKRVLSLKDKLNNILEIE